MQFLLIAAQLGEHRIWGVSFPAHCFGEPPSPTAFHGSSCNAYWWLGKSCLGENTEWYWNTYEENKTNKKNSPDNINYLLWEEVLRVSKDGCPWRRREGSEKKLRKGPDHPGGGKTEKDLPFSSSVLEWTVLASRLFLAVLQLWWVLISSSDLCVWL